MAIAALGMQTAGMFVFGLAWGDLLLALHEPAVALLDQPRHEIVVEFGERKPQDALVRHAAERSRGRHAAEQS